MKFRLLYLDPPWHYRNYRDKINGAAASHYSVAKLEEMSRWDIGALAADDSLIFLWATFPKLEEAFTLLEAWGFEYVTTPFVWVKTTKDGLKLKNGPGFWTMSGAELVLLGRRGKGIPRLQETRGTRQVLTAPALKPHSRKPLEVRKAIMEMVGPVTPRIELFARRHEPEADQPHNCGWYATGVEYDGRTIIDAIEYFDGE